MVCLHREMMYREMKHCNIILINKLKIKPANDALRDDRSAHHLPV